jgi:D-alanyl-D-alanine endopeptidase (penicillin-binding protein 7)
MSLALLQGGWSLSALAATEQTAATGSKASTASKAPAKSQVSKAPARKAVAKKAVTKKAAAKKAAAKKALKFKLRKASLRRNAAAARPAADEAALVLDRLGNPLLRSAAFLVVNGTTGAVILERKSDAVLPIASITKLMTAMVVLDARQSLGEEIVVTSDDIDTVKGTGSRLAMGTRLTREEMLQLALMSSENRAASALARHYPGGADAFVEAMNVKARLIGLGDTRFSDSTGLNPDNVSSPRDLVRMVTAAATYPLIREFSTTSERHVMIRGRLHRFGNTNSLVRSPDWQIGLSKTGYIREAGRCLVMQAWLFEQPLIIVLMDSEGRYTRTADAVRVKKWLEAAGAQRVAALAEPSS